MSKELEIEFKSMLAQAEYEKMLRHYEITTEHFVQQTNLYFDTADFKLKQHGMGLRIRCFDTTAEATLKIPQAVGLLEVTDSLTLAEAEQVLKKNHFTSKATEIFTHLQMLNILPIDLHLIGKLTTKRAEFMIPEGKLVLDESWYTDHHDFELELEVPNASFELTDFKQLLSRFKLPYRKTQNKIVRAVTAQQEQNKRMEGLQ